MILKSAIFAAFQKIAECVLVNALVRATASVFYIQSKSSKKRNMQNPAVLKSPLDIAIS